MTSKHLFYKSMKEDLRHKIWMIALSLLGSFLTMPIVWLLMYGEGGDSVPEVTGIISFYREELTVGAGLVAIVGAVIVGLESFHFLQQRSMVDTYHSLPISRNRLFFVKYVNGLLIWLVPYLLCLVITQILSGILLVRMGSASQIPVTLLEAGKTTAAATVMFLLIYHLLLFAVMLTGNVLNTLVITAVLGVGVFCTYGLGLSFMNLYFQSFFLERGLDAAVYGSPVISTFFLIVCRVNENYLLGENYLLMILVNLAVALLLGALSWLSYSRRASELAGRGTDQRAVSAFLRIFVSILGSMSGWLFMDVLRYGDARGNVVSVCWNIFGAVLAGVLCYGVLDVIFTMDFKAFLRHRWGMAASAATALLICFAFMWDWGGFDSYLPQREQIRQVVIYDGEYTNNSFRLTLAGQPPFTDQERIHAFLERGIENLYSLAHKPENTGLEGLYGEDYDDAELINVRVTLENGRSYYRKYPYYQWDEDVVLPLLCSEAYARSCYYITEEILDGCSGMKFIGGDGSGGIETVEDMRVFREIAEGYNRDLLENPRGIILGEGRMLGRISMWMTGNSSLELNLFDGMVHTLEAMENNGIRVFNLPLHAGQVENITLEVEGNDIWEEATAAGIDPAERAIRSHFGVYAESMYPEKEEQPGAMAEELDAAEMAGQTKEIRNYSITVTDPAEIEELLLLCQYGRMYRGRGVFTCRFVEGIRITDSYGVEYEVCIRKGALPEKYIQRLLKEAAYEESRFSIEGAAMPAGRAAAERADYKG